MPIKMTYFRAVEHRDSHFIDDTLIERRFLKIVVSFCSVKMV